MSKKRIYIILVIIIVGLLATSCVNNNNNNNNNENNINNNNIIDTGIYKVEGTTFTEGDNKEIIYPIISEIKDEVKEEEINNIIKAVAFDEYNAFGEDNEGLSLEIDYTIGLQNESIFSVLYEGYAYLEGAAYPRNIIDTVNIDIEESRDIILNEIIKIDEDFANKILQYELSEEDKNEVSMAALEYLQMSTSDSLMNYLNSDDAIFYLSQDSITISFEVVHAVGDHFELELNYDEISDSIISQNTIWDAILTD